MGEHIFGVWNAPLSRDQRELRSQIAAIHGATFVYSRQPDGTRSWYTLEPSGSTEDDRETMSKILADVREVNARRKALK